MSTARGLTTRVRAVSVPVFLAPAFAASSLPRPTSTLRTFSTSPSSASRRTTGPNKKRGVSAIRSKPPKIQTEAYKYELPTPVHDPEQRALFKMNKNHGLWGFFNEKRDPMVIGSVEAAHGRPWSYQELTFKSFEDLHKLYWTCVLEANRTATRRRELNRTHAGYGVMENENRLKTVQETMKQIREVLRYRYSNWAAARSMLEVQSVDEVLAEEEVVAVSESEDGTDPAQVGRRG